MAEQGKEKKTNFIKGLKAEYNKIIWPTKEEVSKQTVAVVVCSLILGAIIAGLDFAFKTGFGLIIK